MAPQFGHVLIFAAVTFVFGLEETKIVKTKYGQIEGSLDWTGQFYEFLGIRYGIPIKFRVSYIFLFHISN